jgi:DNA-binding phage protein
MAKGVKVLTEEDRVDADLFRRRLEMAIMASGLTAAGLAKKAGIASRTVYRILQQGAEPTRATLVAMARALNMSLDTLATDEPTVSGDTTQIYARMAYNVLIMAYGKKTIDLLAPDELATLIRRCGDVLRALVGAVPPDSVNIAYMPVLRNCVTAWLQNAYVHHFDNVTGNIEFDPLSRACLLLDRADWEVTKGR